MTPELVYAIGALASGVAACLAWVAKLKWSKEFATAKDETIRAKESQIQLLQQHLENLRELMPVKLKEHYVNMKELSERLVEDLNGQLEQARTEIATKDDAIQRLHEAGYVQIITIEELRLAKTDLEQKTATLEAKITELDKISRQWFFWDDVLQETIDSSNALASSLTTKPVFSARVRSLYDLAVLGMRGGTIGGGTIAEIAGLTPSEDKPDSDKSEK